MIPLLAGWGSSVGTWESGRQAGRFNLERKEGGRREGGREGGKKGGREGRREVRKERRWRNWEGWCLYYAPFKSKGTLFYKTHECCSLVPWPTTCSGLGMRLPTPANTAFFFAVVEIIFHGFPFSMAFHSPQL